MNRKLRSFKQTMFISEEYAASKVVFEMLSFGTQSFCCSFIVLSMILVQSQPRNSLFRCVMSLLLLWKPCSWFYANLKLFTPASWVKT